MRAIDPNDIYRVTQDLKAERTVMNAAQIKNEIRKLNRIDIIEIYRWIDEQVPADLTPRIGVNRSLKIRQEIEQKCRVTPTARGGISSLIATD